jgi:hypothetical protein
MAPLPPHLALVTADDSARERSEGGPVVASDNAKASQHRDAIDPGGSSVLGLR